MTEKKTTFHFEGFSTILWNNPSLRRKKPQIQKTIHKIGTLMAKTTETKTPRAKPKSAARKSGSGPKAGESAKPQIGTADRPRQPGVERRQNHPSRAKHGYIQLILTQAVTKLGQPGDLVKVRPGFAQLSRSAGVGNLRHPEQLADG